MGSVIDAMFLILATQEPGWSTIENGRLRVGVDAARGGSIGYLADIATGRNVVNIHDGGRWIGQSYYSGPKPFGDPHPSWKDWPWNPVSAGDVHGAPSRILDHRNDGRSLYVRSVPLQWALRDVPGDCTFETWIRLDGPAVLVRNRLVNAREDRTPYPAFDQELPAAYTVGALHRLVTYDGPEPFTGAPVSYPKPRGPPWTSFRATEGWAALVDDAGWGLAVVHPGPLRWLGGVHGTPGAGGPRDDACGYLSPVRREILDARIVYTYEYALVLGPLESLRAWAVDRRPKAGFPAARFDKDRAHWTSIRAGDALPDGAWRLTLDRDDPQLVGPEAFWKAVDVPRIYIAAAFTTAHREARIYWSTWDAPGFDERRSLAVPIVGDGVARVLEVDLSASPAYRGAITGLRFDPVPSGRPGDRLELRFIAAEKEPAWAR